MTQVQATSKKKKKKVCVGGIRKICMRSLVFLLHNLKLNVSFAEFIFPLHFQCKTKQNQKPSQFY